MGGDVLGISNTEVTPPNTADLLPLSKFSFFVLPGSLKCTCVSTIPGKIDKPFASRIRSAESSIFSEILEIMLSFIAISVRIRF